MGSISKYFGNSFSSIEARVASYDFIEKFIERSHIDWSTAPATAVLVDLFLIEIAELSDKEFAFLVTHSGYIPESYPADSSKETLYSKLVETVILEWAKRIGFSDSLLPTKKASTEDVSILDNKHVIVCDAKSFRLGRSQGAPNVKDVLKHADIEKWLSTFTDRVRLGGLVALPSQHDWKKGSDFYQYTTDKSSPTLALYYEHLSFFLISSMSSKNLIKLLRSYPDIFPNKVPKEENNRAIYYSKIEESLYEENWKSWCEFQITASKIVAERAYHCAHSLDLHLSRIRNTIEEKFKRLNDVDQLRSIAIEAEYLNATETLHKQIENIRKFRAVADDYDEK